MDGWHPTEIFPDSLNLFMVLWALNDEIFSLCIFTMMKIVLKLFHNLWERFFVVFFLNDEPLCWSWKFFYTWSHGNRCRANQSNQVQDVPAGFFFSSIYFSSLFLPVSLLLCCRHQIQNELIFFMKCLTFNIWYHFCILLRLKYCLMRSNQCILFSSDPPFLELQF